MCTNCPHINWIIHPNRQKLPSQNFSKHAGGPDWLNHRRHSAKGLDHGRSENFELSGILRLPHRGQTLRERPTPLKEPPFAIVAVSAWAAYAVPQIVSAAQYAVEMIN
jgi:hypothetical protein